MWQRLAICRKRSCPLTPIPRTRHNPLPDGWVSCPSIQYGGREYAIVWQHDRPFLCCRINGRWMVEHAIGHTGDAPRITMTKSYLSGRQCCDFTIAEDDSETHEAGCPWRLVDEFAKSIQEWYDGRDKSALSRSFCAGVLDRVSELEEDMTSSPIRRVEDVPGDDPFASPPPTDADEPPWKGWYSCEDCNGWFCGLPVMYEVSGEEVCQGCDEKRSVAYLHPEDAPGGPWIDFLDLSPHREGMTIGVTTLVLKGLFAGQRGKIVDVDYGARKARFELDMNRLKEDEGR